MVWLQFSICTRKNGICTNGLALDVGVGFITKLNKVHQAWISHFNFIKAQKTSYSICLSVASIYLVN